MSFDEVAEQIDEWVADGAVPGASIAISHRGEIVAKRHAGEARTGEPVNDQTLFGLASLSKPITAAAFLALCDEGVMDIDATVTDVLPEFGADVDLEKSIAMLEAERDSITFRQLLAHTSGLPENLGPELFDPSSLEGWQEQAEIMLRAPLQSAPGEFLRYSNLGPGIAALAVESVTGEDFHQVIRDKVLQPMGLHNIVIQPSAADAARIAELKDPAAKGTAWESYNSEWWRDSAIPWGGYYGSAEDMLRFTTSFMYQKESVLASSSRRMMTQDQTNGAPGGVESMRTFWDPGAWAVGWEVRGSKSKHWTGNKTGPHTWDHWGFAGTLSWADPDRELAMTVFANRSVTSMWMFKPARWAKLCDDACDVADGRS